MCWYREKKWFECGRTGHTKFMCGKVKRLTSENTDSEADYSESELYNMKLMRDELESDSDEFERDGAYMCHTTEVTDDHSVSEMNTEVTMTPVK